MRQWQARNSKILGSLLTMLAWLAISTASAYAQNTVTKVTLVMTDAQGNVLMTTDIHGNVLARYTYRPYGTQQSGPTNAGPGYTGHVNDPDTGLVYMQKRYYDPVTGRFISPDPIRPAPGNIYSFNRYAYANNNPLRYTDPTGMSSDGSHSSSSCGSDIPPATCKQIRQQQKENERTRAFGGSVAVYGNRVSADAQDQVPLNLDHLECGVNVICGFPPLAGRGKLVEGALGLLERALARLRGMLTVTKGASRAIELLRPGGRLIGRAGTSSSIRILQGGRAEAETLFGQLTRGGKIVKGSTYRGTLFELRGGGRIGFRPTSTSGPPTIDVFVRGLGVREIKFLP